MMRWFNKMIEMDKLSIFISYSSSDKKTAGLLKSYLALFCGFSCFLAHEDILPSQNWEDKILTKLYASDLFVPLISEKSSFSPYVNQEIGMALVLKKPIIPIKIYHTNPFGFIAKIQALSCSDLTFDQLVKTANQLFLLVIRDPVFSQFCDKAIFSLTMALSNSLSFRDSRIIMTILIECLRYISFSPNQISSLDKAIGGNKQVNLELFVLPRLVTELRKIQIDS